MTTIMVRIPCSCFGLLTKSDLNDVLTKNFSQGLVEENIQILFNGTRIF